MHRLHPIVTAVAAAALASGALAQAPQSSSTQVLGTPIRGATAGIAPTDRDLILEAAQAGHAELRASRLALSRPTDPDVKQFARRMVEDHTRAGTELRRIAQTIGVQFPTEPSLAQKARLQLLEAAQGQEFNQRYAEEFGVEAHRRTIELYREAAARAQDARLRTFANSQLPTLQEHLQMAQTLQASTEPTAAVNRDAGAPEASRNAVTAQVDDEALRDAQHDLTEAVQVVQRMKSDPEMALLLQRARGVFIMPNYGRGAIGIGAQGGEGVLVTRQGDGFSNPVFFNLAGISLGAQAGGSGGPLAMLLMTDRAVRNFASGKTFSINADAGLTIVDYSERAQASAGKVQDIIVWSGTRGVYAGASIGVTGIVADDKANRAYYRRSEVAPSQILGGNIPNPQHNVLDLVLRA